MRHKEPVPTFTEEREAGMEPELINKIAKLNFKNQMKMFYTAYSKVLTPTLRKPLSIAHT